MNRGAIKDGTVFRVHQAIGIGVVIRQAIVGIVDGSRDIAGGIRNQYTIGYFSSNSSRDGGFRKVKIVASNGGRTLRVTTREGYVARDERQRNEKPLGRSHESAEESIPR